MKKTITLILIAVMAISAFALTGCSGKKDTDLSGSKYVGKWTAATLSLGDESEEIGSEWILTIKEDGTGTLADGQNADNTSSFT